MASSSDQERISGPGHFFAPHGARGAFFSLGSEILHTSEDGGIYIYIYIYIIIVKL